MVESYSIKIFLFIGKIYFEKQFWFNVLEKYKFQLLNKYIHINNQLNNFLLKNKI